MPTSDPLFSWFEQLQRTDPQRPAWRTADSSLNYRTLYQQTQSLAAHLVQAGLQPGAPLAAVCAGKLQLCRAAALAMYVGCPLLPLKPQRESFLPLLADCGISQILCDNPWHAAGYRSFSLHPCEPDETLPYSPPNPLQGDQVQLLIATSGSTGPGRITAHSGNSLSASVTASQAHTGLTHRDLWLHCLPMHHIGGFAILLRCLHAGAAMLIEEHFDAERIFNDLQQHAVTHLSLVPAMLAKLLEVQAGTRLPDTLRCVLVGGGPLSAALAHTALGHGWPVYVTWGMSETASHVTLCRVQSDWIPGMVGRPIDGCVLSIVDEQRRGVSGRGRIRVKGPMLMRGYCNTASLPVTGIDDGYFTSSDIGYLDANGNLRLCGRADYQLNSGGYNIDPEAVEAILRECPGIDRVAVTAIEDATWGDLLLALFAGPATEQTVIQWCHAHLDSASRPRRVLKTDRLPVTSLGKPDRPALALLAAQLTARR
jgi:O-succinylbenzoic acid--CoA ligase